MAIRVRITINHAAIAAHMRSPRGPAAQAAGNLGQRVELYAKVDCPVDEGTLRNSIGHTVRMEATRAVCTIGSPLVYARYVHDGTGIYGPRRQWIYPRTGKVMRFEVKRPIGPLARGKRRPAKGSRPVVFARKVRGMPGSPFLVSGLERAMPPEARITYYR